MPILIPTHIPAPASPTRCGRGGVAGGEAEAEASAGADLHPIGTRGGRTGKWNFVMR